MADPAVPEPAAAEPPAPEEPKKSAEQLSADFTAGMMAAVGPLVTEVDTQVDSVIKSQMRLGERIDALGNVLQSFNQSFKLPPYEEHALKLSNARARVAKVNEALIAIQRRLDSTAKRLEGTATATI